MFLRNSARQRTILLSLLFISICVFSAITAGLSWHIYAQLNNTLFSNGKWLSTKFKLEKSVYGAAQYFMGTLTLAQGELNLGAWYGYQEVVLKEPVSVEYLSFNTLLSKDSYMIVMLNREAEQFHAIRLSNHPDYQSAHIYMDQSGEFISVEPFSHPPLGADHWHWVQLVINREVGTVSLRIDEQDLAELPIPLPSVQHFGFRGSYNPAYIDFIEARDDTNTISFSEDFSYQDDNALAKKMLLFIAFFVCQLLLFAGMLYWRRSAKIAFGSVLILMINLVFALVILLYYLHAYYLPAYPNPDSKFYPLTKYFELQRKQVHDYWSLREIAPTIREYQERGPTRVLFIGSSQTWGAGAQQDGETFVHITESLANTATEQEAFTFINTGKSGAKSSDLLTLYTDIWLNFHPHVVVLNLSNNDDDAEDFEKNLRQFAQINAERGIETVFVLEANSPEFQATELHLHPVMKKVAQQHNIQLVDMHTYLREKRDTGMMWWDNVHLTSYGHRLAGEYLFDEMSHVLISAQQKQR